MKLREPSNPARELADHSPLDMFAEVILLGAVGSLPGDGSLRIGRNLVIYYDTQDSGNPGWSYSYLAPGSSESGPLDTLGDLHAALALIGSKGG